LIFPDLIFKGVQFYTCQTNKGFAMNEIPILAMIARSGWVARVILLFLAALSVGTWSIIFYRWSFVSKMAALNKAFMKHFDSVKALVELDSIDEKLAKGPLAILGRLAAAENKRILSDARADSGAKDMSFYFETQFGMASERFDAAITTMEERMQKGLVYLALASACAPFLGLLGTVWGIMDAFFQIGEQGSASLPVVAPGIAEALIATVIGLVVAIPALFFYNIFVRRVERFVSEMDAFSAQLSLKLKREIFALLYRPKGGG
jgi:biopolymer transport protein TolQ